MAVDKLVDSTALNSDLTSIADAIREKGGTSSPLVFPGGFVTAINDIPSGGSATIEPLSVTANGTYNPPSGVDGYSPVVVNVPSGGGGGGSSSDPVKFIDYDGTILHSYSVADFMAFTALPENPSHSGLTAQGWNWSLADAKAQLTAYPEAGLTIGQMYITDDGKTRIYVHFEEARRSPYLGICPNGTVTVDWGDGSATSTLTGTSLTTVKTVQHEFPSAGDYVITLTVESGEFAFFGVSSTSHILKVSADAEANISRVYTNAVQKIELGVGAYIGDYAFGYCMSLETITIPKSVTSIATMAFYNCYSLASITIPNNVTSIGGSAFNACHSLTSITIPEGVKIIKGNVFDSCYSLPSITITNNVTSIESSAFRYCYSLASLTIPDGVTSIATQTFRYCYGMKEYHFLPTTPPTLANTNAFQYIPSDCIIYVPQGSLEAYQTATNWSTYASKMREEPT